MAKRNQSWHFVQGLGPGFASCPVLLAQLSRSKADHDQNLTGFKVKGLGE